MLQKSKLPIELVDVVDHFPAKITSALKIENQAQFHPRAFLLELAKRFVDNGGQIFEHTRITTVKTVKNESPILLESGSHAITADDVVIATNYPIFDHDHLYLRLNQMRSYALAFICPDEFPTDMYIGLGDDEYTYRSFTDGDTRWLIVGGQAHPAGQHADTQAYFDEFKTAVMTRFSLKKVDFEWSAQDAGSLDRVPLIGKMPSADHIFVVTGFGEWGMSTGVLSGMLLADLITEKENEWASLYDPTRLKPLAMVGELKDLSCGVVKGYSSRILPHDDVNLTSLRKGEGTVISRGGKPIAVSRDEHGKVCALSAVCTHMGCAVNWNTMERSWDCPCHGSRFTSSGEVIHGPATEALSPTTL